MSFEGEWRPEGEPDLQQIFLRAREDAAAGQYPEALAKHLWFHHHALEGAPAFAGVRLSYALADWGQLGAVYPPALEALTAIRDEVENKLRTGKGNREEFIDCFGINQALGQESRTTDLFRELCENHPKLAALFFDLARAALIRAKEYSSCGRFLNPKEDLESALILYRTHRMFAANPEFGEPMKQFGEQMFANEVATQVAILVINGRKGEAQWVVSAARREWPDRKFKQLLRRALQGEVPDPYP